MKRTILFFLAALTLLALLPLLPSRPDPAAEVLRLHILANSDSPEDQAVKLRVRDALLPLFEAAASYDDARSFVLDHGAALLDRCQTVLVAAGVPYGAQLLLGVSPFPDRTYNGTLFPAGPYASPEPPAAAAPTPFTVTFESDILAFLRKHFGRRP